MCRPARLCRQAIRPRLAIARRRLAPSKKKGFRAAMLITQNTLARRRPQVDLTFDDYAIRN
jgi:hypothetical protein